MAERVKCPSCSRMTGALERRVGGKKQKFQRRSGAMIHSCPWGDCLVEDFLVWPDGSTSSQGVQG